MDTPVPFPNLHDTDIRQAVARLDVLMAEGSVGEHDAQEWAKTHLTAVVDMVHSAAKHKQWNALAVLWPVVENHFDAVRAPQRSSGMNLMNSYTQLAKTLLECVANQQWGFVLRSMRHSEISAHVPFGKSLASMLLSAPVGVVSQVWSLMDERCARMTVCGIAESNRTDILRQLLDFIPTGPQELWWLRQVLLGVADSVQPDTLELLLTHVGSHQVGSLIHVVALRMNVHTHTSPTIVPLLALLIRWHRRDDSTPAPVGGRIPEALMRHVGAHQLIDDTDSKTVIDENLVSAASHLAQWAEHDTTLRMLARIMSPMELLSVLTDVVSHQATSKGSWRSADVVFSCMDQAFQTMVMSQYPVLAEYPHGRSFSERRALAMAVGHPMTHSGEAGSNEDEDGSRAGGRRM